MASWYDNTIFYHIYPLGLLGAPRINNGGPIEHRISFLSEWISHMKELSVGAVYIGPLFESLSHGYDTTDYRTVDRRLGDNKDFREFVCTCHRASIRVVVDGVFNHTGRLFFAFQDIKARREASKYRDWYKGVCFFGNNVYNDGFSYESWHGSNDLVNLNLSNQVVRDYLLDVVRFWIHEFDIDGIRLDCADVLDFEFMRQMRCATESEKPCFWLMGEVIHGDYSRWANRWMLHSVTNYELNKGLWSGHNDHNYFEIAHTIRRQFDENFGIYKGRVLYSFADNHDVSRVATLLRDRRHLKPLYTLLYTLPGDPSVYYGSEWGIEGEKKSGDEALRPAIDLDKMRNNPPFPGLEEYLEKLGQIRIQNCEIGLGRYQELFLTNRQYAFARIIEESAVIIAVNNDVRCADMCIPIPVEAGRVVDLLTGMTLEISDRYLRIRLQACGSGIYRIN